MAEVTVSTMAGGCVLSASCETVGELKRKIQYRGGARQYQQRVLLGSLALEDDADLTLLGSPLRLNLVAMPYQEGAARSVLDAICYNPEALEKALRVPANPDGLDDQEPPLHYQL